MDAVLEMGCKKANMVLKRSALCPSCACHACEKAMLIVPESVQCHRMLSVRLDHASSPVYGHPPTPDPDSYTVHSLASSEQQVRKLQEGLADSGPSCDAANVMQSGLLQNAVAVSRRLRASSGPARSLKTGAPRR